LVFSILHLNFEFEVSNRDFPQEIKFFRSKYDITWKDIGIAFNKEPNTIQEAMERYNEVYNLPPKIITKKSIITPDIGRNIKSIVKDNPKTPYRKINKLLREKIDNLNIIPSSSI
jgi:uncharacterized metal-binding protein